MGWIDTVMSALRPNDRSSVPEDWLFFTTERAGNPVGVFSNTALSAYLAARSADHVIATLRCRTESGGRVLAPDEDATLEKLGNRMEKHCAAVGGTFLGRTTGGGARCHYYLLPQIHARLADELVGLSEKAGYRATVKLHDDPGFALYANDLLPTAAERRQALDEITVTHLSNSGDIATAPHVIDHWAEFGDADSAQSFVQAMQARGYAPVTTSREDNPFVVRLSHEGQTSIEAIAPVTAFLDAEVQLHGGRYEGWGTSVVTKLPG